MSSTLETPDGGLLRPTLTEGLRVLSADETITFVQYVRTVLPLDGFVFWLRTAATEVQGSLHVTASRRQEEDQSPSVNRVVFTSSAEVESFNRIGPGTLWVGESKGVRFAFSESGPYYAQAGLFHYVGDAVYPALASQLVDVGAQLPRLVVSNSLPVWLTLCTYDPPWLPAPNPKVTLYPSYLVPANLTPPYGVVHVEPSRTVGLQQTAAIGPLRNHYQLARDAVRVTLYGVDNDGAMAFLDLVDQFTLDTDAMGLTNIPIVRDEKRAQPETGVLAMKKVLDFEVTYNQTSVRNAADQMITQVVNTYSLKPGA